MNEASALRLADATIKSLRRNNNARAVWLIGENIQRTPHTDSDIASMLDGGARLVGVFTPAIGRADLRDAIMEAANERG